MLNDIDIAMLKGIDGKNSIPIRTNLKINCLK